jgi:hypothetical protein
VTSNDEGRLMGGPHDGVTFNTNDRFWHVASRNQLPEPAQRVYATVDGRLAFWFTGSLVAPPLLGPRPPLSRYDLCPNDPGWVYRYAGEE